MNKAVSLLLISALFLSACVTTSTTEITWPTYTEGDSGLIVEMNVGDQFTIDLSESGALGYVLDEIMYENDQVKIVDSGEIVLSDSTEGKNKWVFEALAPGATDLVVTATLPGDESGSGVLFEATFEVE
jgi:predicted secreted protein